MKLILQDRFKLLKEGKITEDVFLKESKQLYPSLIRNSANIEETTNILKNRKIISENFVGLKPINVYESRPEENYETAYKKYLAELKNDTPKPVKAVEKATTKAVEEAETAAYDYKDKKKLDNLNTQQFIVGMHAEAGDKANQNKTYQQLSDLVVKNLLKDELYYVKNSAFGIKGIGYTDEAPGLKASKSDKMEKIDNPNLTANLTKSNTKDVTDKMPKSKVKDEMTTTPKSSKGVQKMALPGKEKKIKLSENQEIKNIENEIQKLESENKEGFKSEIQKLKTALFSLKSLSKPDPHGKVKTNENTSFASLMEEPFEIKNDVDEKINDLIQHKIFMQEMNMDDYSPEEAYQFLRTEYSDEDIIDFHEKVYGYGDMELEESRIKFSHVLDQGYNSYIDGKQLTDNPYDEYYEPTYYRHWEQGFKQAEIEEKDNPSDSSVGISLDETEKSLTKDELYDLMSVVDDKLSPEQIRYLHRNPDKIDSSEKLTDEEKKSLKQEFGIEEINTNKNTMNESKDHYKDFKKFLLSENNISEYAEQNPNDNEEYNKIYSDLKNTYRNSGDNKNLTRKAMAKFKEKFGREPMLEKCGDDLEEVTQLQESKKMPISKRISEIEKMGTSAALETKINAIDEEITRRTNQLKMVDENADLSELVDKRQLKFLQNEIKLLEKQKDKYSRLYEKATGKKKSEVVTDSKADAAEESPIEEASEGDVESQQELTTAINDTKKAAEELDKVSQSSGLAEEVQPSEEELTKMKDELDSYVEMVSNFEEAVDMYISLHPESEKYKVTLRQLAEPMF